jgi:hypothetical protein
MFQSIERTKVAFVHEIGKRNIKKSKKRPVIRLITGLFCILSRGEYPIEMKSKEAY